MAPRVSSPGIKHRWLIWALVAPSLLAVILTALGARVVGVDDLNYAAALGDLNVRDLVVEQASWILLNIPGSITGDSTLALRLAGLLAVGLTIYLMTRKSMGPYGLAMFVVSILPLYIVLYFAQLRFLVAFVIFVSVYAHKRLRLLAGPASLLGHLTGIILPLPAAVALIAPLLSLASYLDPSNIVALKISAYLGAEYFDRPWYFGWELLVLAGLYGWSGRWLQAALVAITVVGIYTVSDSLGVIVARRLLELALLAYSPIILYLRERRVPPVSLIGFYIGLGAFQTAISLAGGVVSVSL